MRPMRRQDREIKDPEKILSIIAACPYCHLGFSDQGKPYVVPVNFGYAVEDGRTVFYFHGARDGYVAINGWKELSPEKGVDFCRRLYDAGVGTIIYTDISRDGAEQGTNLSVYRELAGIAGLRVTASGGISSLDELRELQRIGTHAAILGKALYTGRLDLKAVLEEVGVC